MASIQPGKIVDARMENSPAHMKSTLRVLVIDDEKFIADTLVMILEQSGREATAAYDGPAAMRRAETFQPNVVISDVIMPGMNGIETCMNIQAKLPKCHIILFSGQAATSELVRDAWEKGFTWELLAKPIEPEELLAKLADLPGST
jgi:CheY-like chemotaxis protein